MPNKPHIKGDSFLIELVGSAFQSPRSLVAFKVFYGGAKAYIAGKPLFYGLAIGYVVGVIFSMIVDLIWFLAEGHRMHGW